jgi:putative MFS transporter
MQIPQEYDVQDRKIKLDDLPTSSFHKRIAFLAAGGPFCDGYLFGIIVVALPFIAKNLALSSVQVGLLGSASLIGMFIGGIFLGPMTDKFGRQSLYVINLVTFLLGSLAFLITKDFTSLFIVRLLMGVALGADYPIATALACEFLPKKIRGPVLSSLMVCFWLGFVASLALGFFVPSDNTGIWPMILASSAIPSAIFLVLRFNVPESPRWLLSVGRVNEAREVVRKYLGEHCDFESLKRETPIATTRPGLGLSSIRELFAQGYGRALVFCGVFWTCQIAPSLAIKTFQPMLLSTFGVKQPLQGTLIIT